MQLTPRLHSLTISSSDGGDRLHLALLLDEEQGPTLVDTGLPGSLPAIEEALQGKGLRVRDLRRIIVTHADLDHVGALAQMVAASGAEVWASPLEAPFVDGSLPDPTLGRVPAALLASMPPQTRARLERGFEKTPVHRRLLDGERLEVAGGVRVVATPGHSSGHLSLFVEQDRALITGDAIHLFRNEWRPFAMTREALPLAARSVARLAQLEPRVMLVYHGGVVREDPSGLLQRLGRAEGQ